MIRSRSFTAALGGIVVAATGLLAGCTGSDGSTSPTDPPPDPTASVVLVEPTAPPTTVDPGRAYLVALTDPAIDPSTVAVGAAALYVEHRHVTGSVLGRFPVLGPGSTDGSGRVCTDGRCVVVDGLTVDPSTGLIVDVLVDGRAVGGWISGNGPLDAVDGVAARVRTAYVTGEEQLIVTVEVDNVSEVDAEVFPFAAVFRPVGSGAGVEASGSFGNAGVGPGGSTVLVLVFDTAELVGRIGLRGILADGLDIALDVEIPDAA